MRSFTMLAMLAGAALLCAGCSTFEYKSAAPTARSFSEDPMTSNRYYGLDFTFAVDRPTDYHPATETADVSPAQATASTSTDTK